MRSVLAVMIVCIVALVAGCGTMRPVDWGTGRVQEFITVTETNRVTDMGLRDDGVVVWRRRGTDDNSTELGVP